MEASAGHIAVSTHHGGLSAPGWARFTPVSEQRPGPEFEVQSSQFEVCPKGAAADRASKLGAERPVLKRGEEGVELLCRGALC